MKKLLTVICTICLIATLCACQAEDVNNAINGAASKAGVDVEVNIKQEQLDSAAEVIKNEAEKAKDVITSDEVKEGVGKASDFIKDKSKKSKDNAEPNN